MALLCVEIHKGTGFPQEAIGQKLGLRWRSVLQHEGQNNDNAQVSRRGQLCDVVQIEFPDVPIHPRLHSVIDKLAQRKYSIPDIAQIVGVDNPDTVTTYLHLKEQYLQKYQEKVRVERHEDHRVNLQWYETLTHMLHEKDTASLRLELLDGEDNAVGLIGPLSLKELFNNYSSAAPRRSHSLYLPRGGQGGLAAWFAPARKMPVATERFVTVELQLSARLRYLRPSHLPKSSGQSFPRHL